LAEQSQTRLLLALPTMQRLVMMLLLLLGRVLLMRLLQQQQLLLQPSQTLLLAACQVWRKGLLMQQGWLAKDTNQSRHSQRLFTRNLCS
jgi:hypothetical protein